MFSLRRLDMSEQRSSSITALVLAGGRATRMGGMDKGLLDCGGRPLIEHVLERVSSAVDHVLISANRNLDAYRRYGPVVEDADADFPGPLAGIERGLERCETEWLWIVPCDAPRVDAALLRRLRQACTDNATIAAVPVEHGHWQPTFALLRCSTHAALTDYLARCRRAVHEWLRQLPATEVPCDDRPEWFVNLNTPEEMAMYAAECKRKDV